MSQLESPAGTSAVDYAEAFEKAADPEESHPSSATRLDSQSTLHNEPVSEPHSPSVESPFTPVDRPNVLTRYATDVAAPVAIRPVLSQKHRKSTGAALQLTHDDIPVMEARVKDSISDDSSDEDGAGLEMQKSHTAPAHSQLSTKRLNRVKQGPEKRRVRVGNDDFQGTGRVQKDGRLKISVNETIARSGYLSKALGTTLSRHLKPQAREEAEAAHRHEQAFRDSQAKGTLRIPRLNIVVMVIGSRGEIESHLWPLYVVANRHFKVIYSRFSR